MKRIERRPAPDFFLKEIGNGSPQNWEQLDPNVRHRLCDFLIGMQHDTCAYTELSLTGKKRKEAHIDHFYKKGMPKYNRQMFEFSNLFAAYYHKDKKYGACYKDEQLNDEADYQKIIKPDSDDPAMHITFAADGMAEAVEGSMKGDFTIKIFNLNHPYLVKRRCEVLRTALYYSEICDDKGNRVYSNDDIVAFFPEFHSAIRSVLP